MTQEEIKSYLVKLAYSIDKQSEASFLKSITGGSGALSKLSTIAGGAAGAVALVSAALTAATAQVVSFTVSAANANKENERFARMMFTSERAAYSFNTALQAMGKSMDDIAYMTPEEYQRFNELRNLSNSIGLPNDYNQTMRGVRDTVFEVTRLKVVASQAMSYIAYYIAKYLELPMERFRQKVREFSDWLQKNIPKIADVVGKLSLAVIRLAEGVAWLVGQGLELASVIGEKVPTSFLAAAAGITAFFALMSAGPVGWFIAGLSAILLLLDDIATWQRGGDSLFGGVYEAFASGFKKSSFFDQSTWDEISEKVSNIADHFSSIWESLVEINEETQFFTHALEVLEGVAEGLGNLITGVTDSILDIITNISVFFDKVLGWFTGKNSFIDIFTSDEYEAPKNNLEGVYEDKGNGLLNWFTPTFSDQQRIKLIQEYSHYDPAMIREAAAENNFEFNFTIDKEGNVTATGLQNGLAILNGLTVANIYAAGGYAP